VRIVVDEKFDIELRIVGDGPSRAFLERLVRDLGVEGRVRFLGAVDEPTKMRELYAADLLVLPSLAEGLPSSIAEAMAVGVPVIATNIAGTSELVEHEKTGLLVQPSDPEALARAIIRMIGSYDLRTEAAKRAREKLVEEFDVIKETAKLREYFLEHSESSQPTHELNPGSATATWTVR
jgi:glycosyltransferase involved in cell wall biosynthesis